MTFEVLPVLSAMETLYQKPITIERFKTYLRMLQGGVKGGLKFPIGGFNPMAKPHLLQKIKELQLLGAEDVIATTLSNLTPINTSSKHPIQVALNIADDEKGGWTNRYTTDFDSKFNINALVTRNFCTPYFWSSEIYTKRLIEERTLEYVYRTLYWRLNGKPRSLEEHVQQERYVYKHTNSIRSLKEKNDDTFIKHFYHTHKKEESYHLLFNFFYGDDISSSLGYPTHGIKNTNGFEYIKTLV